MVLAANSINGLGGRLQTTLGGQSGDTCASHALPALLPIPYPVPMTSSPIRGRALEALRAVALHPRGLRLSAHPSAMPALIELGYVVERQARWEGAKPGEVRRFITSAGRELLKALGSKEEP